MRKEKEVKIPMLIMQTWKTEKVPDHWKQSQESVKIHMPDWKYVLMTDKDNRDFVVKHFPSFVECYDNFEHPIQRADAIRYMWLYVNGGLYMDLDIQLVKPIDELFYVDKDIYVVRSGNIGSVYTNAFMAAKPKQKIFLKCLEAMKKGSPIWAWGKHLKVMTSTGPLMFSRVVKAEKKKGKMVHIELPRKLIMGCSVCEPKPCDVDNGYCRTLQGSSWIELDSKFYIWMYCNKEFAIIISIVIIVLFILVLFLWLSNRK
jgi:mannosyltransferase OCH1-like enzyme